MDAPARSLVAESSASGGTELWEEAYSRVEAYFAALRIRNKLLLSQLVTHVLERAAARLDTGEATDATRTAIEEVEAFLVRWFRDVLDRDDIPAPELLRRGRLALLLADASTRWPHAFLAAPPYPPEFVQAMRAAYVEAGPQFKGAPMKSTAVDFGPLSTIAESSLRGLERWPVGRALVLWGGGIGLAIWIFLLTR